MAKTLKYDLDINQPIEMKEHPCIGCKHYRPAFVAYYDADDDLVAGALLCHMDGEIQHDFSCREEGKEPKKSKRKVKAETPNYDKAVATEAAKLEAKRAKAREYAKRHYEKKKAEKAAKGEAA